MGLYFLIHDYLLHHIGDRNRQLIRPRMAKTDGKGGLRIHVHEKHLFPFLRQADTQILRCKSLTDAALLISAAKDRRFIWHFYITSYTRPLAMSLFTQDR